MLDVSDRACTLGGNVTTCDGQQRLERWKDFRQDHDALVGV